jgi:hypothetical protein
MRRRSDLAWCRDRSVEQGGVGLSAVHLHVDLCGHQHPGALVRGEGVSLGLAEETRAHVKNRFKTEAILMISVPIGLVVIGVLAAMFLG